MNEGGIDDLRRGYRERKRKGEKEGRGGRRKFAVDCSDGNDMHITWYLMVPHTRGRNNAEGMQRVERG